MVFKMGGCKFCVCFSGDSIQDISPPLSGPPTPFLSYYMLLHFYKLIVESTF
jgi:hypothetical protein